jgi:hypothetical protein
MKIENWFGFVKRLRWHGPLAVAVAAPIIVMALLIFTAGAALAQTVFTTQVPTNENFFDSGGPYELGMTFSSTSAGNITAIRHWKALDDNVTHVGRIWDESGAQLAEVTFANETASGWQQKPLTTPLPIDANTTYTVSVNCGTFYPFGSDLPLTNDPLTGFEGVFSVSPGTFPTSPFGFHYFRDIVFAAGGGEPTACIVGEKYVSVTGPGGPFVRNSVTINGGAEVPPENLKDLPMATFGGTPVFYQFVIKNCGNVDLYNVRLDDCADLRSVGDDAFLVGGADGNCVENPRLIPPDPDRIVAHKLGPGESVTVTSTDFPDDPISTIDICETFGRYRIDGIVRNDSQVEADADLDGNGIGETFVYFDDLNLVQCKEQPCIKIFKEVRDAESTGEFQPADSCGEGVTINNGAEYRLTVTNCGPEDLRDVVINDEKLGITGFPVDSLIVDETKVFFFNRPEGGIEQLLQPDLCQIIDGQFENLSSAKGVGVVSLIEVADTNSACVECQPECNISVNKTCKVVPPEPVDGDVCDVLGKPVALTFQYKPGTDVVTGQDPGKAEILFQGAVDDDGVSFVIVTDEDDAAKALAGAGKRFFEDNVAIETLFEANEDIDDFGSTTFIHFFDDASGALLQSIEYHTSCSQPIQLGDVIGNATVVEYEGEIGSASAETPEPGAEKCTIQLQIADCDRIETLTGDKPDNLTWQYTGGGCAASDNDQDSGDLFCTGTIDGSKPVTITDDDGNVFEVEPDGVFTTTRDASKVFTLTNAGGTEQNGRHVSCSQPLVAGDVYGSLTLAALEGIGIGAEVRYLYKVTNNNDVEMITDIAVVDDPLALAGVPGSPIAYLLPGESETLELTTFISETTVNTVTVNGKVNDSPICEASDTVTVTVLPPPPCEVTIAFYKLEDDKLKYKLTNAGNRKATLDNLTVNFPPEYGLIKEVKLDGAIFKKGDSNVYPNGVPSGATIGPNDWTEADVTKRQLDPDETRTLEVVFSQKDKGAGWIEIDSAGTATFEESCAVELIKPSDCALGKPTALVFEYTGDACSATTNLQEGSFKCGETGALGNLVSVEMTKDANKFSVAVNGNEVTIAYDDPAGEKMPSEIEYRITGSTGETQSQTLHTSCSKPLNVDDQFGALILREFVPEN